MTELTELTEFTEILTITLQILHDRVCKKKELTKQYNHPLPSIKIRYNENGQSNYFPSECDVINHTNYGCGLAFLPDMTGFYRAFRKGHTHEISS